MRGGRLKGQAVFLLLIMNNYKFKVFPFGKYKGTFLKELPLTYVVYALEEFNLPEDLEADLQKTLVQRLKMPYVWEVLVWHVCTDAKKPEIYKQIKKLSSHE